MLVYNLAFDFPLIRESLRRYKLGMKTKGECVMELYAGYFGDRRSRGGYRWQRLNGGHDAVADCLATLELIRKMADQTAATYWEERPRIAKAGDIK